MGRFGSVKTDEALLQAISPFFSLTAGTHALRDAAPWVDAGLFEGTQTAPTSGSSWGIEDATAERHRTGSMREVALYHEMVTCCRGPKTLT